MTQEEVDKVLSFDEEIIRIIKWRLVSRKVNVERYSKLGGFQDGIQIAVLSILKNPPKLTTNCRV